VGEHCHQTLAQPLAEQLSTSADTFLKVAFLALLLVIAFALAFYMLLFEPDEMVSDITLELSN